MVQQTLQGKVAVIGGGERNLGGLLSTTFARDGAKVVVHCHNDEADADATVKEVQQAGAQAQRLRQDRELGYVAAERVHRRVFHLCRWQGPVGALHASGGKGVRRPRHFGERGRTRTDGHIVLLPAGERATSAIPPVARLGQPAHPDRRRRAEHSPSGHGRLVVHRADAVPQRGRHTRHCSAPAGSDAAKAKHCASDTRPLLPEKR